MDFAGTDWIARIQQLLVTLVAANSPALIGTHFSISETFTRVPPDGRTTFWGARIADGELAFLDTPDPQADFALVAEQPAALPGAKFIYEGATAAQLEALESHRRAMVAAGRLTVTTSAHKMPAPIATLLRQLHDQIARETTG